jgi:hypothetical protein
MDITSKENAQSRADQIAAFQAELAAAEHDAVLSLNHDQHTAITQYHNNLLSQLSSSFDIDSSHQQKQLSLGMKIASFIGAIGIATSIFFLFYKFWGSISTTQQVFILICAPIIGLLMTVYAASKEKTGYFSKLFGLATLSCFVLNLSMLGQIFNISPTPNAFMIWAVFAFLLAYAADARLLLAAGIILISAFLSAQTGTWGGGYWISFGERPENFFPTALLLLLISLFPHRQFAGFRPIYRVFSMLFFFIPVLILSNWGLISYLNLSATTIEILYQITGFVMSAVAIWLGIKKAWPDMVNTGNVFFTIFLYTKIYDWWWELMPKYLFFLVIGLSAILMLLTFKRLRNTAINNAAGG